MRKRGSNSDFRLSGPLQKQQRRVPFWKEALLVALLSCLGALAAAAMAGVRSNTADQLPGMMGTICKGSKTR